jgi:uncharacterized membrane protein YqjE
MPTADRTISTVLSDIVANLQDIVRSELRLAKTEVTEELGKARTAGILIGVGTLLVIFSTLFLLLAGVYALSNIMPGWAAALIVGTGAGLIAALCFGLGIRRFKSVRAAPKTVATVKENVEWAKQPTR